MAGSPFHPLMPLHEAQAILRTMVDEGADCPCCTLFVKVYRHKLDSAMARTLIRMHRSRAMGDYLHVPSLDGDNHKVSQCSWWGLVEELKVARPDGGKAGYWRLTPDGTAFVLGELEIMKYARIYNARVLGHVGDLVTIRDCLGDKFNYTELMTG